MAVLIIWYDGNWISTQKDSSVASNFRDDKIMIGWNMEWHYI